MVVKDTLKTLMFLCNVNFILYLNVRSHWQASVVFLACEIVVFSLLCQLGVKVMRILPNVTPVTRAAHGDADSTSAIYNLRMIFTLYTFTHVILEEIYN